MYKINPMVTLLLPLHIINFKRTTVMADTRLKAFEKFRERCTRHFMPTRDYLVETLQHEPENFEEGAKFQARVNHLPIEFRWLDTIKLKQRISSKTSMMTSCSLWKIKSNARANWRGAASYIPVDKRKEGERCLKERRVYIRHREFKCVHW